MLPNPDSLYLVLPVPFRLSEGRLFVEAQAANGLDRWADHFAHLTVAAPVIPESQMPTLSGFLWRDLAALQHAARIVAQPLPWAYTPSAFLRQYAATRKLLARSIAAHRHLQFAIGGLVGDWAALAALEAISQQRAFAIHTDRVEHELIRRTAGSLKQKLRAAVEAPLMEQYHRHIISHASLGLWHGDDCFRAYSPWLQPSATAENHLIHDIHTKASDLITESQLAAKLGSIRTNGTLRIVYAGRLDPMKDPLSWLSVMASARKLGASLQATWYGEGPLTEQARAESIRLNLADIVEFPGFLGDRPTLLSRLRDAHLLLFTHTTPESPRILLEALVCGTPIVGYDPHYASDLVRERGGGQIAPLGDTSRLAQTLCDLAHDRNRLAGLTREAAGNGRRFTDAAVFAERSALVKRLA